MGRLRHAKILGDELCAEEGNETAMSFINQLRGYNVAMGAFKALAQDICQDGASLKPVLNKYTKRLGRFKENIENSSLPDELKENLLSKADNFLADAERMVQDLGGSCRKTAGECTIGARCLWDMVYKAVDEITRPE
jgi:ABC-type transporter Mla subunit MlaD